MRKLMLLLGLLTGLSLVGIAGCRREEAPLDIGLHINRTEILSEHNKERSVRNAEPLKSDPVLQERAQKWAELMARRHSLTHSRLQLDGTPYSSMGENIAMGYPTIDSVMDGWMESPGHKRNILSKRYTHAGFGYAKAKDGSPYWCAQFGGN
jgi:uncharacterized protein YkwD